MQGVQRHVGHIGLLGILHDRESLGFPNRDHSPHTILATSGQQGPNDTPALGRCRRSKERIDGWPRTMLFRTALNCYSILLKEEVMIGWSQVDEALPDLLSTVRFNDG